MGQLLGDFFDRVSCGVLVIDSKGGVSYANAMAVELTGMEVDQQMSDPWLSMMVEAAGRRHMALPFDFVFPCDALPGHEVACTLLKWIHDGELLLVLNPAYQRLEVFRALRGTLIEAHRSMTGILHRIMAACGGSGAPAAVKRTPPMAESIVELLKLASKLDAAGATLSAHPASVDERHHVKDLVRRALRDVEHVLGNLHVSVGIDEHLGKDAVIYGNGRWLADALKWVVECLLLQAAASAELRIGIEFRGRLTRIALSLTEAVEPPRPICDSVEWSVADLIVQRHGGRLSLTPVEGRAPGIPLVVLELPVAAARPRDAALVVAQARRYDAAVPSLTRRFISRLTSS
jgi:hypothetical protein